MKLIIMAVRDRAADCFFPPMFTPARGRAIRDFQDEVQRADEKNQIYKHPEDFDLYELGTYDDATGRFDSLPDPKQVAVGKDFAKA